LSRFVGRPGGGIRKIIYTQTYQIIALVEHLVRAVCAPVRSPLCNGGSKVLKNSDGAFPVDAGVGNGNALQTTGPLGGHLLVALVDVGLDHDTDNARLSVADLVRDVLGNNRLVAVVLVGVAYVSLAW
jgi:hypothetical protein